MKEQSLRFLESYTGLLASVVGERGARGELRTTGRQRAAHITSPFHSQSFLLFPDAGRPREPLDIAAFLPVY